MNNPLVSTVITTYKRDVKYVKEALDSVVSQTYRPIEILIIDDNGIGSVYEKELRNLCSVYNNVLYLPNKMNCGAQVSRNNGIKVAKGDYLAFLDDDDIWEKTKIEKQMKLFTDDSIGMVYCDGYSFEDGDMSKLGIFREASIFDRPITYQMELFNDWIGSTSQALIRRSVLENVGYFDPDMPARQDYEMWLRISSKYKIVGCPDKLLYYRIHTGDRISTNWDKCLRSYQLIISKYSDDYNKNKYAKAKLIMYMSKISRNKGDYFKTIGYSIRAFFISPKCLLDMIERKLHSIGFAEFYQDKI